MTRDWQHLQPPPAPAQKSALTRDEELAHSQSLREVVHYTANGVSCVDCDVVLSMYPAVPFASGAIIVMLDKDPRATWTTVLRKPNCMRR